MKPRVLLFFAHRRATEGLTAENLAPLLEACDVETFMALDDDELPFGRPVAAPIHLGRWQKFLWAVLFYARYIRFLATFDRDWLRAPHLFKGQPPYVVNSLKTLRALGLLDLGAALARRLLAAANPYEGVLEPRYDAVVAYTGVKDPWCDHLTRWARRHRIPVMQVTVNWDNISSKPIIERPDYLGLWGPQALYFARAYQNFPFDRMFQLGAARFQPHHALPQRTRAEWRRDLGLPEDGRLVLFAGAGEHFAEEDLLEIADKAIADGRLPADVRILYKPHPVHLMRGTDLSARFAALPNILVWNPVQAPREANARLLAASDAICSAYSTMVLEGAFFGIPSLGFFYNDDKHAEHDWEVYGRHPNLLPMFIAPWNVECRSKADFLPCLQRLLALADAKEVASQARESYYHCAYHDGSSYGDRLLVAIGRMTGQDLARGRCQPGPVQVCGR